MRKDKYSLRFNLQLRSINANETHEDVNKVQQYLKRFGYLILGFQPGLLDLPTQLALRLFQELANIPVTGVIDPATADKLEEPRCGVSDKTLFGGFIDLVAFDEPPFIEGCKYEGANPLTYAIINKSRTINEHTAGVEIRRAFNEWQNLIPIDFKEVGVSDKPTLTLGWFTNEHGDGSGFDGVGHILAHAFPPPKCGGDNFGKCHFDDDETWSDVPSDDVFDLHSIALHEIGHLLGIGHIKQQSSVMYQYFAKDIQVISPDDKAIPAIQLLYGHRSHR